jgi:MraZ protein
MFQGAAALSLDAKGRFAIPARHREALASAAERPTGLTAHPHRCLLLYPEPAWEPIRDKVLAASSFNPQSAAIKRLLVGNAREERWTRPVAC